MPDGVVAYEDSGRSVMGGVILFCVVIAFGIVLELLRRRERRLAVEMFQPPWWHPYLWDWAIFLVMIAHTFALHALGLVRRDEALLERAASVFDQLGLSSFVHEDGRLSA